MAGIYGIDPILDFTYQNPTPIIKVEKTFPEDSLMYYIEKNHPKYAFIVKKADLAGQFADLQFRGTVFIPKEESLNENMVMNLDQNTARTIVKYHLMIGFFPKAVLTASAYQKLQPAIKSEIITAALYRMHDGNVTTVFNDETHVIHYDIQLKNGYIHILDKMMQIL